MPQKIRIISQIRSFMVLLPTLLAASVCAASPAEWGVHKIWGPRDQDGMAEIRGTYIMAEWADVNPAPGQFDFSKFDEGFERVSAHGQKVTIAIRGSFKPDFLFDEVPYHPEALSVGVHDDQGSLQYWHPRYIQRHRELLQAFANYLNNSPYRSMVYSIRQNTNALGTEHSGVAENRRAQSQWIVPPGASFVPYSDAENANYQRAVLQAYYDALSPNYLVLVRTVLLGSTEPNIPGVVMSAIENGTMGLVHTSSVPEPLSRSTERKYDSHVQYGRNGVTPIYAEPYDDSDRGPQPRAQWNYWRLLSDLHSGVSYISVYGADLDRINNVQYREAFEFTNRYAGYLTEATRGTSPGAWVALRQGGQYLTGDYSFLMNRMSGDPSTALSGVGSGSYRQGAWARRLDAGARMRFQLNNQFANSLQGEDVRLRVTYFDSGSPSFSIETPGSQRNVTGGGSGTWRTFEMTVGSTGMSGNAGADVTIRANSATTLHMVEIQRTGSAPTVSEQAPPKNPTALVVN